MLTRHIQASLLAQLHQQRMDGYLRQQTWRTHLTGSQFAPRLALCTPQPERVRSDW